MSKTNEAYRFIHAQGVCCKKDLFTKFGLSNEEGITSSFNSKLSLIPANRSLIDLTKQR